MSVAPERHLELKDLSYAAGVVSVLTGLSLAYSVFVLLLQTPVISLSRLGIAFILFIVFGAANYYLAFYLLREKLAAILRYKPYAPWLCLLLPLLLLPLFYSSPAYPIHPLLRPWTEVAVQYKVDAVSPLLNFSRSDVRLQIDKNVLDAYSFRLVGTWNSGDDTFRLEPGETASLQWVGTASETMLLTLQAPAAKGILTIYWDHSRTAFDLTPDSPKQIVLVRNFSAPWGVSASLFAAVYILIAWFLFLLVVLFDGKVKFTYWIDRAGSYRYLILLLAAILAVFTVKLQLDSLNGGADSFIHGEQLRRHIAVLDGQAPNPWQYRVLSEYVAEGFVRLFQFFKVQDPISFGFISLRFLQNTAIFLLAFALYHKISGRKWVALAGLLLLTSSMRNAFYDNDLSFNTYFDVILYLLALILILDRKYYLIVLVSVIAALNRETGGLIPLLMLAALVRERLSLDKKLLPFVLSTAAFAAIFFGLRILYPNRPLYIPYEQIPGYQLLTYNVTRSFTWEQLFHILGLIPLTGLLFFFVWPSLWRRFFFIVCPIWFGVHFVLSVAGETRLFLVPQAIIFIPGVLFVFEYFLALEKKNYLFGELI